MNKKNRNVTDNEEELKGMQQHCKYCGKELPESSDSRRTFCNDAHKQAYYRQRHQATQWRIATLEQQISHLEYLLDVEKRYHQDTEQRGLKAWLKKQLPSPLGTKLLADELLPARGSRGLYEAHLRSKGYSPDEMQEFAHLWKALLLSQP